MRPPIPTIGILSVATVLCGCNVLGPRYEVRKQAIELRYAPDDASPPLVAHAGVNYELRNTGNTELTTLIARMPPNLQAEATQLISPEVARRELPLDAPWGPKQSRKAQLEYSFAVSTANRDALIIADRDWLPRLLPPEAVMARGGEPPEKVELDVTLPAEFRIAAPGRYRGARTQASARRHRFELTPADLPPYIIAGRYEEHVIDSGGMRLHLWTAQPLERAEGERAGAGLAAAVSAYVAELGPLPDKRMHLYLVDAPAASGDTFAFPGGVVFYPPLFPSGRGDEVGMCRASRWLAGVWFEAVTKPRDEARDLAEALALSLASAIHPQCRAVDSATAGSSIEREKARLFVGALEERIGKPALHVALKRMVQALARNRWGLADLRAAAEGESKQDLAEFFRVWNTPGIPAELRSATEMPKAPR